MNCPHCGHAKTSVKKTLKAKVGEDTLPHRIRQCPECKARFETWECYEPSDPEVAFDSAELLQAVKTVVGWLERPARSIPLVRDARKHLLVHLPDGPA